MRVLFDIGHPAHVHMFKNVIRRLEKDGHAVKIVVREKEMTCYLLDTYGFKYETIGKHKKGILSKLISLPLKDLRIFWIGRKFKPDILVSHGSMYAAHASKLLRKDHISLEDTEESKEQFLLYAPFTDAILTPSCFKIDLGKKQVKFNGYKELSYLHPNYFRPDPSIFEELGISKSEKFIVLRFISWGASHDVKLSGVRRGSEIEFIKSLEKYGKVFITSEAELSKELNKYKIRCSPEKIHSLLYYSQLYIGEGGTMATESALLGTPSIHIEATSSGQAVGELFGNFLELRDEYDLVHMFSDQDKALKNAIEILSDKKSKSEWKKKRNKLLKEKIDVAAWITDFIENYPKSFYSARKVKT